MRVLIVTLSVFLSVALAACCCCDESETDPEPPESDAGSIQPVDALASPPEPKDGAPPISVQDAQTAQVDAFP